MWRTLGTLGNLTFVRVLAGLANSGLNALALRDLFDATVDFSPVAILVAVAWLIPWHRIARVAYHRASDRFACRRFACRRLAVTV